LFEINFFLLNLFEIHKKNETMSIHSISEILQSNSNVFIHSVAAAPQHLINEFCTSAVNYNNISIYSLHTEGIAPFADEKFRGVFNPKPFFVGKNMRQAIQHDHGSYVPVALSNCPTLFRNYIIPLDIALVSVSPPDQHGYCSLGLSADVTCAAVECATYVIAQINNNMPRTFGDTVIHVSEIDLMIEHTEPLPHYKQALPDKIERQIGENVAEIIQDGSTIQTGIGSIPNAVLGSLHSHRNLGIHSEMISDAIIPLIENGVITNRDKKYERFKTVCSFALGTSVLYDYLDRNTSFLFLEFSKSNEVSIIASNPKVVAINGAIEIDLTGQVCADSIGSKIYSGAGGQPDFIRGAAASVGGKPIIAIRSTTSDGKSKIVNTLAEGSGVVTTRTDVHWVVTEYGAVNLFGKSLHDRAMLLTSIAHPSHRDEIWNKFEREHLLVF
jgi:acyl-CoA hydrolase